MRHSLSIESSWLFLKSDTCLWNLVHELGYQLVGHGTSLGRLSDSVIERRLEGWYCVNVESMRDREGRMAAIRNISLISP